MQKLILTLLLSITLINCVTDCVFHCGKLAACYNLEGHYNNMKITTERPITYNLFSGMVDGEVDYKNESKHFFWSGGYQGMVVIDYDEWPMNYPVDEDKVIYDYKEDLAIRKRNLRYVWNFYKKSSRFKKNFNRL